MTKRVISSVVAIPILLAVVIAGGLWFKIAIGLVACIGMYELYKAVSKKLKPVHLLGFVMEIMYIAFIDKGLSITYFEMFFMAITLLILMCLIFLHRTNNVIDGAVTIFGFAYVGMLMSCAYQIRAEHFALVWLPFMCAWGSDTGAYLVGRKIGKHKLAPALSPHKSIEGSIGGMISAAILCGLYCWLSGKFDLKLIPAFCLIGVVGSIFGQLGDLAASSIKRYTGIKDYGHIMPGHGGVLDRFDSVLFTLPIIYIFVKILAR